MNSLDVESRDFGWLVGILEGEGSFGFVTNKGHKYATIRMMSTDEDVVSRIRTLTGIGSFMGPYTRSAIHKPIWRWEVSNRGAVELMNLLLPYMSERRKQRIVEVLKIEAEERVRGRLGYVINGTRNLQKARESKTQAGQVTVLAALMLIVFVSVAAFCMNAAYAFHRHTQMQADVDTATLHAAGTGCSTYSSGGMSIQSPPLFGAYKNNPHYCGGTYSLPGTSLFGKIMPVWFPISVQAIALHGGSTEPNFSMLGLSVGGVTQSCSVYFGGSEGITVTGNIYSDSSGTKPNCGATASITPGNGVHYSAGSDFYSFPPAYLDPFMITTPSPSGLTELSLLSGPYSDSCGNSVTGNYYVPVSSSGVALLPDIKLGNGDKVTLLPYCASGTEHPGIYLVDETLKSNGFSLSNGSELDTVHSTIVIDTLNNRFSLGGGKLVLQSPTLITSPFKGYAMYEATPCSTPINTGISGSMDIKVDGLFDLSCVDIKINGGATDEFDGAIVANSIWFTGNGGSVTFNPPTSKPPRGAFLVQ